MADFRLVAFLACLCYAAGVDWDVETDFDRYVKRPDSSYGWQEITENKFERENCTIYTLNMTSQTWKDDSFSTISLWFHHMTIAVPKQFTQKEYGFIFIGGGRQTSGLPNPDDDFIVDVSCDMAAHVGVAAAYLKQIPNQPMYFRDDPTNKRRTEDSIIAYTWKKYMFDRSDPDILLRYPMTKAVIRAMDTVTDFVKTKVPDSNVNKFLLTGGSKRGWTAWTAAAMDWQKRVVAVVPIVMDLLLLHPNLMRHYMAYGGWSFAFDSYYSENITKYAHRADLIQPLADQVDPYSYKERLTMPKIIMSASGDEFFLPDDSHIYFQDLPGPTYMLLMENTHHAVTLSEPRAYFAIEGFYQSIISNRQLPIIQWSREATATSGSITLTTNEQPKEVIGFVAETMDRRRRDFRYISIDGIQPVIWVEEDVEEVACPGECKSYRLQVSNINPDTYTGMVINVIFDGPNDTELDFTSEINIVPDTYPFQPCTSEETCYGTLV